MTQPPHPTTSTTPTVPLAASTNGSQHHPTLEGSPFLAMVMPSDEGERQAQAMENWFQACASDEPFALEIVGTRREQGFLIRASSEPQLTLLCKQVEAQYPQAQIQRVAPSADPLILHAGEHAVVGEFGLLWQSYRSIKTFPEEVLEQPGADPLAGILAPMETIGAGARILAQLVLVRAPEHWLSADIRKSVEHALQPERDQQAIALKNFTTRSDSAEGLRLLALLGAGFGGVLAYRWYLQHAWLPLTLLGVVCVIGLLLLIGWNLFLQKKPPIYDTKRVAEKMARAGFYTQLRVIVIGQEQRWTRTQLTESVAMMEVAYRQFTLASSNGLFLKRKRSIRALQPQAARLIQPRWAFPYTTPWLRLIHGGAYSKYVLNALELSGLFHLPQETADVPLVRRVSLKGLLASPEIAQQIKQTPAPLPPAFIGHSEHRRHRVPVYLPFEVLFSHKFFTGMSRSGKSVLIQLLTQAAMQPVRTGAGRNTPQPGVFVADPHRDLIMDLLKLVPPSRAQDVLLLDMTDTHFPVALNPLDASMGFTRDQAVSNLMSSFQKIWSEFWGPRMAYFLNAVCLLLYTLNERLVQAGRAEEQYTLLDINPLLQYKDYAVQVLSQLDMSETWHQELLAWWQNTYFTLPSTSSFRQEIIMPILSKIGVFNDNAHLRRIVGQPVTKAPVHQAVTEGKIVLCALAARDMDDSAVNILGSTLINLLHRSFGLQQPTPLKQRRKVFVAIDEFQNFSGGDFDKMLSEDAKYGCAMLLATQNLTRLNKIRDGLLEMVLSNCQHLCVFRISAADAELMEQELQEKVTIKHIISQPNLHCYARLAIPGYPIQIVSVTLARPASWHDDPVRERLVEEIRSRNQQRNRPVSEVDRRYEEHLHQFLHVDAYAGSLQREAKSAEKQKRDDARANDLAQEVEADQENRAAQGATSTPRLTGSASQTETPQEGTTSTGPKKSNRNHRRNDGAGKHPVGAPPPEPAESPSASPNDATTGPRRPPPSAGVIPKGSPSGREGREHGER